jgi:hypothetical protein
MTVVPENLWRLARGGQPVDAAELAAALEQQAGEPEPDFRTRLLVRDSLDALAGHWGRGRLESWLADRPLLRELWLQPLGPAGFPSLTHRLMDATKPDTVMQFFRDLGDRVAKPSRLDVGGSTALILSAGLSRHTDDIDVVDEVPAELRQQYDLLAALTARYGLSLTHFQSHYLPTGWGERLHSLGRFGKLDVFLVDVYDVLAGKVFSAREKDLDDLRAMATRVDKQRLADRLRTSAGPLRGEPHLEQHARRNWYVVYGEDLPA